MHLCLVIQPCTNSQIDYLSGLCGTVGGSPFLLGCIIIMHLSIVGPIIPPGIVSGEGWGFDQVKVH